MARDLSGLLFPGRASLAAYFRVVLGSVDRASAVEKLCLWAINSHRRLHLFTTGLRPFCSHRYGIRVSVSCLRSVILFS